MERSKYVKTKMPAGGGVVLKRDYFCLLVSACPILVFNYPIHLINSPLKGSGILFISMFLNILPKEDSTFLK